MRRIRRPACRAACRAPAREPTPRTIVIQSESTLIARLRFAGRRACWRWWRSSRSRRRSAAEGDEPALERGRDGGFERLPAQGEAGGSGGSSGGRGQSRTDPPEPRAAPPMRPVDPLALDQQGNALIDAGQPEEADPDPPAGRRLLPGGLNGHQLRLLPLQPRRRAASRRPARRGDPVPREAPDLRRPDRDGAGDPRRGARGGRRGLETEGDRPRRQGPARTGEEGRG